MSHTTQTRKHIVHFKELFALDGKEHNISENDIGRRNSLLSFERLGLVSFENEPETKASLSQIKLLLKEKGDWF